MSPKPPPSNLLRLFKLRDAPRTRSLSLGLARASIAIPFVCRFRGFASAASSGTASSSSSTGRPAPASTHNIEHWDCHSVAVWAFQITDDPAVLDFFAQRMRLNGLALAKLAERNRMKEIELQMRGANIQFADVKCDVLREALKDLRVDAASGHSAHDSPLRTIYIAVHAPSTTSGEREFTGRFSPYSVSRNGFYSFLQSRGAAGVVAKSGGAVITHYEGLVEGEDYVLVRGGFDGEDSEALWPRVTAATARAFVEDRLASHLGHQGKYRSITTRRMDGRSASMLVSDRDPSKSAVLEYLDELGPTTLPTPLPNLLPLFPPPTSNPIHPPPRPLHILASPVISPDARQKLFALSPIDIVLARDEWEGWGLRGRKRLVEVGPPDAEEGKVVSESREEVKEEEEEGVVLEPMNVFIPSAGGGLDKVVTGDVVGR